MNTEAVNDAPPGAYAKVEYSPPEEIPEEMIAVGSYRQARGPGNTSEDIYALAVALAKAQGRIDAATKGNINPHFKSRYADLASVWDACRAALSENGLSIVQLVSAFGTKVTVTTLLLHGSGQWIRNELTSTAAGNGPQQIGAVITYLRRYSLAAMVGVAPDDDDGNAGQAPPDYSNDARVAGPQPGRSFEDWEQRIMSAENTDALKKVGAEVSKLPAGLKDALRLAYEARTKQLKDEAK
jgi:hypothetical protein